MCLISYLYENQTDFYKILIFIYSPTLSQSQAAPQYQQPEFKPTYPQSQPQNWGQTSLVGGIPQPMTHQYPIYPQNIQNNNMPKGNFNNDHFDRPSYPPKPQFDPISIDVIKNAVSFRIKSLNLVLSREPIDSKHRLDKRHHYNTDIAEKGLQNFTIQNKAHPDIFSLYFSVPLKEAEERKKKAEEERRRLEEEEKARALELLSKEAELEKLTPGYDAKSALYKIPRVHLPEAELNKTLDQFKGGERQLLDYCVKNMKTKGKISLQQMMELSELPFCKLQPNEKCYVADIMQESKTFNIQI